MSKKGVSKISGNTSPQAGDKTTYTVDSWHTGTPADKRNLQHVTWELFKKRRNGQFTRANIIKKGDNTFTFGESVVGDTFKLFGYLYHPEGQGLLITPRPKLIPKIEKIELLHVDNTAAKKFNVNDRVRCKATCTNMFRKKVIFRLWEDDANGKKQDGGTVPIDLSIPIEVDDKGHAFWEFTLINALIDKAKNGEADLKQFEFFVSVEYYPHKRHNSPNVYVDNPDYKHQIPPANNPANNNSGTSSAGAPSGSISDFSPPHNPSVPAGVGNQASTTSPQTVEPVSTQGTATQDQHINTNSSNSRTPSQVNPGPKIEGLIDAYFARKEYTKKTGEVSGTLEYEIGSNGNKTSTDAEKEKIAKIILEKPKVKDLSKKKEYTTIEAIKDKLTKGVYSKGEKITFQTFKLGEEFKKIASAPLEEKVYLVASSYLLEGKNAKIIIKEKDGLIKGSADAVLPALEITEAQMEQSEPLKENERTEKTEFSGTIKKVTTKNAKGEETQSEMLIIPIQLRPKSDDDLKAWKEKLNKGKEDGDYTYIFGGENKVIDDASKKRIAATIIGIVKKGNKNNKKLEEGKNVNSEEIEKVLQIKTYKAGDTITFKLNKNITEMLWLEVTCNGVLDNHKKEFLKSSNIESYFRLSPPKLIIFPTLEKPINDADLEWEERYWAETKKDNVVCFGAARTGRKHAARDLYTNPSTAIVAIADGMVIGKNKYFGANDVYVSVLHNLPDGRKFIVKYCELAKSSVSLNVNDKVIQKQELGKTAHLGVTAYNRKEKKKYSLYMCHFELYDCSAGETNPLYMGSNPPYMRRRDLIDPLAILLEGYENSFGKLGKATDHLFTVDDGKQALLELYNRYKNKKWSWKWNGSETEIEVSGKDLLTIVEKMYRLETTHFTSAQYQNCGTGGMEVFGPAPYYGWDPALYTEQPVGSWSAFEGAGLSGSGGNTQVTNRKKEFIKFPSVVAGMEYKINYIIKYTGNFERWFNKNDDKARTAYRTTLSGIRAKFIAEISGK